LEGRCCFLTFFMGSLLWEGGKSRLGFAWKWYETSAIEQAYDGIPG
jgi:hypothetical protein